jgi:hypothetical protein
MKANSLPDLSSYGPFQAKADTGNIEIKSLDGKGIAFDSRNVNGNLDFDARSRTIQSQYARCQHNPAPGDQYKTTMNEFTVGYEKADG